ncbi:borealin-like [Penaeus japonicus]|uniref:borealin-like n=1 Tax=Penaeus japonicus TaxID=27405 RepID=UPI001C70BCD1|nr:borealin-like [Penaeus japonicus]
MPRKKRSRVPSRAKPTLPDDSSEPDMEAEQRKEKLKLLLEDFDLEVEKRKALMEEEIKNIQESIRQIYKIDLLRYPEKMKKMLWHDHIKQNKQEVKSSARNSLVNVISSADSILQSAAKKRAGRPRKAVATMDDNGFLAPVTRSTRASRQKPVFGNSQVDNMLPPPSTGRPQRTRKVDVAATPANQNIPPSFMSSMLVTPKFDPRTPLPPGTIKRRPKLGEIAISLTGSPLQVSPALKTNYNIKGLMQNLDQDNLDEETRAELEEFHAKVGRLLNM